jgi:hypothetical protein
VEEIMKKSFVIITIIFLLIVLGCNLPFETSRSEKQDSSPQAEKNDSEEKEKLKEKIADLEKKRLEEKIDELEKKVEDKNNPTSTKIAPGSKTNQTKPPRGFVRVNSPRDGFLALRTAPSSERGQRILKIPHGTLITIYNCTGVTSVGGTRGRWCQTVYEDNEGWVFDAYLIR